MLRLDFLYPFFDCRYALVQWKVSVVEADSSTFTVASRAISFNICESLECITQIDSCITYIINHSAVQHLRTCEPQLFGHIRQELDMFVPI